MCGVEKKSLVSGMRGYEGRDREIGRGQIGGVNGDRGCLRSSCSVPVLACQVSTQVPRVLCLQRTGAFHVNTGVLGIICPVALPSSPISTSNFSL